MTKKLLIAGAIVLLGLAALGLAALMGGEHLNSRARKQWKNQAIAEITQRTRDTASVLKELESLTNKPSVESEWDRWISKDLIVMTNGEWMVYRNVCAKEAGHIPDLFIGRGSDDKWYYSTYHFCIDMLVLRTMMEQPESLAKFRQDGYLREFDGRSDECLNKTWPPRH